MSISTSIRLSNHPGKRYMNLIRQFPLRPLRGKADIEAATKLLDRLMLREDLDPGEEDYARVLVALVEEYETIHDPLLTDATGADVLRELLSEHGLKQADLAKILGVGPSAASMILGGDRPITADHARKLAARFGIGAGAFL
jgi:HTH-type transcriptional regulator/antitoxin HigA